MPTVKVAGCSLNQTPFDWAGNKARIVEAMGQARKDAAAIVCLPELCITGYGCEDAFFNPHVNEKALEILQSLLPESEGMVVSVGLPMHFRGALYSCSAVMADAKLLGFVAKKSHAGDGVHYEPRWFKAWEPGQVAKIECLGASYPFGDLFFDFAGVKVGFEICEEAWVAHRPGAALARRGIDVILNPSASHFAFGKIDIRKRFVCEGSRAFHVAYVYSNLLGNEAGRIIYDGGVLIADNGEIVASGPRFSFADVQVSTGAVDVHRNRGTRARSASYRPDFSEDSKICVKVGFKVTSSAPVQKICVARPQPWESSGTRKEEEFTRATALGLFDFLRKSRQSGFVVSLSGGVDSAAVTLLCRIALDLAALELGLDGLKAKLSHIHGLENAASVDEMATRLISCAYQGTQNSSVSTQTAAAQVARDCSATFYDWKVDELLKLYTAIAENATQQKLTWQQHDITLQNIQARARGPAIWMIANLKNGLLLATSNRSEAAVGYTTMDGDTCGGISPIGGIDKAFLRQWAAWARDQGPAGLRSFPSLGSVLATPPTAELRPHDQHQTDEDDLMPYEILDEIEKLSIRDKKSPLECFEQLQARHSDEYQAEQLKAWTIKFFRLWCRNQWKRERYAPAFHLDDENLDPKTWCRFPILSSGFEEELNDLL